MSDIDRATRWAIYEAHNRQCFYCAQPLRYIEMEIDHIVPQSLTDEPLQQLIQTMLLPADWDVRGLQNVVPTCRPCNGKKRDLVARPQHVMYLLTIAEGRLARVRELAARYTRQAGADNLRALIEHALAGGLVWDDFAPGRGAADQGGVRLTRRIDFVDLAVSDLRAEDVAELRRRRLNAEPIEMQFRDDTRRRVATIDEYDAAREAGAYPATATDLRCEGAFKNASAVFRAVANAQEPLESYVRFPYVGVCDIALLPSSLVQILGIYDAWMPYLERMPTIGDMVKNEVLSVEAVGSAFIRVKPKIEIPDVAVMKTSVWELLRADLNGDGIEDVLVGIYGRAVGGSHGHSADPVVLTRRSDNSVLEVV